MHRTWREMKASDQAGLSAASACRWVSVGDTAVATWSRAGHSAASACCWGRSALALVWALALSAAGAHAQAVTGVVVADEDGSRVEGAMVVLIDASGAVADRALTDARGLFSAEAEGPGEHTLRVDRIGFARSVDGPFLVTAAGVIREVRVTTQAIRLRGINVSGERRCDVSPAEGRSTALVWEEIRKALEAAEWTAENAIYRYTLLNYLHVTDLREREVYEERRSFERSREAAPFYSVPISELVDGGFVQPDDEGGTLYFAPDAAAFLSGEFLSTHCFGLERSGDEIGLSFGPVPDRLRPDIEGVMWLDMESATLRRLEFTYVNVPIRRGLDPARGFVNFTSMPNGTWIVKDWEINMPQWSQPPGELFGRGFRRIRGGATWRVSDREGTIVLESATATAGGRVVYGAPVPGLDEPSGVSAFLPGPAHVAALAADTTLASHTVRILGTGESAEVEADGSFILPGLAEGRQSIEVRHPLLDTMGLRSPATTFEAALGEVVSLDLPAPRTAESLVDACRPEGHGERPPLLVRIQGVDGPLAEAEVSVNWAPGVEWPRGESSEEPLAMPAPALPGAGRELRWSRLEGEGGMELRTQTDARGTFVLCEPPYEADPMIAVWHGEGSWVRELPRAEGAPAVILVFNLSASDPLPPPSE